MDLILLQKVKNLGDLGDKVSVKPGYGRNFLLPTGKATRATAVNIAQFEARRAEYEAKAKEHLSGAQGRQAQIEGQEVTITANASPEGKLFGSVSTRDIAEALTAKGIAVDKSEVIQSAGPIRNTGEYDVIVSLHADIHATVKVFVVAEKA
ncbi:MAG TPA: 50S ribosomal protein L9 [Pinirhizobacter sp.]|jgi:large subunit ribosomal protein L9|uniref:50S ribosomal protein L9 n=1 Tax=Pinirhizobacter sp. TaxID=2950432 RepID=UPI002D0C9B2C|nr:50S ribosomal protein L9 [Pinirhizobacter sp.]HMH69246.1 50S ribosomal protein L9 [Pinirhizobacter sp.]